MKFAELIGEVWAEKDYVFNERYYTESVALMILFKHLEAMIPKQSWYEQGYRANIVTYSISLLRLLIKRQFKDMDLDLQGIWQRQSVPDIISKVLEDISEQVFRKITDPSRQTINVTQWCKRDACWKSVQEIDICLPASFTSVLISKAEKKTAESEAKQDQRIISGAEAQTSVLAYSAEQWRKLSEFAAQKKMLSPDEMTALRYACQIPNKIPSPYQSQRLLGLLERVFAEGFKF